MRVPVAPCSVPALYARYQLACADVVGGVEGSAGGHGLGGAEAGPAGQAGQGGQAAASEKQVAGAGGAARGPSARAEEVPTEDGRKAEPGAGAAESGTKRGAPEASAEKEAAVEPQGKRRKTDPAEPGAPPAADPGTAGEQAPGGTQEAGGTEKDTPLGKAAPVDALSRRGLQRGGRPRFTWAECIPPLPLPAMRACGVPLPHKFVKVGTLTAHTLRANVHVATWMLCRGRWCLPHCPVLLSMLLVLPWHRSVLLGELSSDEFLMGSARGMGLPWTCLGPAVDLALCCAAGASCVAGCT